MNKQTYISLLEALDDAQWQAIIDGEALLIIDDLSLAIGSPHSANVMLTASADIDVASLRANSLAQADESLTRYYRTHPLTRKGFTVQATALVEKHGEQAFAALAYDLPERTLFVDGGELIAESQESPRHRYGAFCELELEQHIDHTQIAMRVRQWLESGAAHERYLEMNVCRYTC